MADSRRGYWREVTRRAWTLSKHHFAWVTPVVMGIVVFALRWQAVGWDDAMENVVSSLFAAGAAVLVGLAIYGRNVARAAAEIDVEQLRTIEGLEGDLHEAQAALSTKQKDRTFADALKAHDDRAVNDLCAAKQPLNPHESAKWLAKDSAWETGLFEIVQEHGGDADDVRHLTVLGNLHRPGKPRFHSDETMNRRLTMLDIRRDRIREIIKKYDPDAY